MLLCLRQSVYLERSLPNNYALGVYTELAIDPNPCNIIMGYSYDCFCYGRQSLKLKPKAKRTRNPESDETVAFSIIKRDHEKSSLFSLTPNARAARPVVTFPHPRQMTKPYIHNMTRLLGKRGGLSSIGSGEC